MILDYITLFSVGKGTETLSIDRFERTDDLIVWESADEYSDALVDKGTVIDGGIFSYGLVAGVAAAPDVLIEGRIVSFLAPPHVHSIIEVLDSVVRAMRSAEWPEWAGLE